MPIIDLQRKLREAGRIRLGTSTQAVSQRTGKPYRKPKKLATFRLTSQDPDLLEQAAQLYGGTVTPWPDSSPPQWELTTDVTRLPCRIAPTELGFSQWYEAWNGGLCQRRCDGARDLITDSACDCDPDARECKPTTRLSVLLTDLPGSGTWRLESHGRNAAEELNTAVALIEEAAGRGLMLDAFLLLVKRQQTVRGKDGKPATHKFVVPALDVDANLFGRRALASGGATAQIGPGAQVGALLRELDAGDPIDLDDDDDEPTGPITPIPPQAEPYAPDIATQAQVPDPAPRGGRAPAPLPPTGAELRTHADRAAELAGLPPEDPAADGDPEASSPSADPSGTEAPGPEGTPAPPPAGDASEPPTPPRRNTSPDEGAKARAKTVGRWCREIAGLKTEEERHRFLCAFSNGDYGSAYDVPDDHLTNLRGACREIQSGALGVMASGGTWILFRPKTGLVATDLPDPAEAPE